MKKKKILCNLNFPEPHSPVRAEAFTSMTTGWVFLALTPAPHVRPWPPAKRQPSLLGGPKGGALHVFMIKTVAAALSLLSPFGWCCVPSVPAVSPPLLRVLGDGDGARVLEQRCPLECSRGQSCAGFRQVGEGLSPPPHCWSTKHLCAQRSS